MGRFDEFPGRGLNHELEDEAIAAFQKRLAESGAFVFQGGDQRDYGTDSQIEVLLDRKPTNEEVRGSTPLGSTIPSMKLEGWCEEFRP